MQQNDTGRIYVNQGLRDAVCLGVNKDRALVEYEMPNGRTYLLEAPAEWPLHDWPDGWGREVRNVSQNKPPARWRQVLQRLEEGAQVLDECAQAELDRWDGKGATL